jgi:putative ABC transport system permease protein
MMSKINMILKALGIELCILALIGLVFLFGGAGTWAILRAPPVPYLRTE